jgi:hypothetical protein
VLRVGGISADSLRRSIDQGLVTPTDKRVGAGRGGGRTITVDDALLLLAVAALAVAAGIAFTTMLKAVRAAGGQVSGAGVTIPIPGVGK